MNYHCLPVLMHFRFLQGVSNIYYVWGIIYINIWVCIYILKPIASSSRPTLKPNPLKAVPAFLAWPAYLPFTLQKNTLSFHSNLSEMIQLLLSLRLYCCCCCAVVAATVSAASCGKACCCRCWLQAAEPAHPQQISCSAPALRLCSLPATERHHNQCDRVPAATVEGAHRRTLLVRLPPV